MIISSRLGYYRKDIESWRYLKQIIDCLFNEMAYLYPCIKSLPEERQPSMPEAMVVSFFYTDDKTFSNLFLYFCESKNSEKE